MIITVGHTKGGVGKSTIAANLAVCFALDKKKVLLIDADVQGSTMAFRASRGKEDIKAMAINKPTLHKDLKGLTDIDAIVVDSGGRDFGVFRSALLAADLLIIPCLASQVDFWANDDLLKIIEEARPFRPDLKVFFLFNLMQPNTTISKEAKELINNYSDDIKALHTQLNQRVAYKNSYGEGKGVVEWTDNKAKDEMKNLYNEILGVKI
jgi:chromosome partitioning protein